MIPLGLFTTPQDDRETIRPLRVDDEAALDVVPDTSLRNARSLRLQTSWLERIESYLGQSKSQEKRVRANRTAPCM